MSYMNESSHIRAGGWDRHIKTRAQDIWMGHVIYEWVMSCMNESCYIWMSHVIYE